MLSNYNETQVLKHLRSSKFDVYNIDNHNLNRGSGRV